MLGVREFDVSSLQPSNSEVSFGQPRFLHSLALVSRCKLFYFDLVPEWLVCCGWKFGWSCTGDRFEVQIG